MSDQSNNRIRLSGAAEQYSPTTSDETIDKMDVKHHPDYPDLEKDMLSLKLDTCWGSIGYDHIDNWVTIDAFQEKYRKLFNDKDLKAGLQLMVNAARKSRAAIVANVFELPVQLYSRLIGNITQYEIIEKYVSCLIKMESITLVPMNMYWPRQHSPELVAHYHSSAVSAVCLVGENEKIIFGDDENNINIYKTQTAEVITTLRCHNTVNSLSVSQDGRLIVSGSDDHTVRLWDTHVDISSPKILRGHSESVKSVSMSRDGRWIVSGSHDCTVRLWDTAADVITSKVLNGHSDWVRTVAISCNGRWIVSGSADCTVRLWDCHKDVVTSKVLAGHRSWINSVSISEDGRWVVSGSGDSTVRLWYSHQESISSKVLKGHRSWISNVSISPDGRWIVSGSADRTIRLWDAQADLATSKVMEGHSQGIRTVVIDYDGRWIVSGSHDRTVRLWDTQADVMNEKEPEFQRHVVMSVAVSLDRRWIVSGSTDGSVRLWDSSGDSGIPKVLEGHSSCVRSVYISSDGRWIVSGSHDRTVILWDSHAEAMGSKVLRGHSGIVTSVGVSGDGRWIVSGSTDCTVRLWDSQTDFPKTTKVLQGHRASISCVSISGDGQWVVSANDDVVQMWDRFYGLLRYVFLPQQAVSSLSFTSSNSLVVRFGTNSVNIPIHECGPHNSEILTEFSVRSLSDFPSHSLLSRPLRHRFPRCILSYPGHKINAQNIVTVSDLVQYFNYFNGPQKIPISGGSEDGDEDNNNGPDHSTVVKIICIYGHDAIRHTSATWSDERQQTISSTISSHPFYCKDDSIYDSDSKSRIARLPSPVLSIPNSVTYNEESKTLVVFLHNGMTCFYRVNEKRDETKQHIDCLLVCD